MSQTEELSRVQANIGELVERFVLDRWQTGRPRFYIQDLHDYIAARTQIAPASPDRILRQLRLEGKIDYTVVSRSESCYEITALNQGPKRKQKTPTGTIRNPKQEGTPFWDCIPQVGPCLIGCGQCFYNRPGAYYVPIDKPHVPTPEEVGDGIVRMNCGNDSNNQRDLVIETAKKYQRFFFNTSIPRFDFPGPVVLTANPKEEQEGSYAMPNWHGDDWHAPAPNLMFVRLRTSATNLRLVDRAVAAWTAAKVPVVITFMAYYDHEPVVARRPDLQGQVLRVAGPPHQLVLVPDQGLHAVGHVPLPGQSTGLHVQQHRIKLLPGLPQLRDLLSANHEEAAQ